LGKIRQFSGPVGYPMRSIVSENLIQKDRSEAASVAAASSDRYFPETNWEFAIVPLRFDVGGVVLGAVPLRLCRRSASLSERPLARGEIPDPPAATLGSAGYVVWSQPIETNLPVLTRTDKRIVYAPRQYRRFVIDMSGDFDDYLAKFSAKTRATLRRKRRKLAEASGGAIAWEQYRTAAELLRFFDLASGVSARSYQERLLHLGLPRNPDFIKSAQDRADQDQLRAFLLFLDGRPIAYLYCPVDHSVVRYAHLGFDPAHAALSPGTVLQLLALEALFAERRYAYFDFTEGEGQHKELFSTGSRLCADLYVLDRRLQLLALITLHHGIDCAASGAGALLQRLGLKARLRRFVRSRLFLPQAE
jgi:hypothetical protein